MITDAVIKWFSQITTLIINLLPEAPLIVPGDFGSGLAAGTRCCASVIIGTVVLILRGSNGGSATGIVNHTPLPLMLDYGALGFFIGCLFSIIAAFFIVKLVVFLWQQVKW